MVIFIIISKQLKEEFGFDPIKEFISSISEEQIEKVLEDTGYFSSPKKVSERVYKVLDEMSKEEIRQRKKLYLKLIAAGLSGTVISAIIYKLLKKKKEVYE